MTAAASTKNVIDYERPWVYPKQEAFLFTPARYSLVEATTKSGKTQGCLIWLLELAMLFGFDGWNGWWVAPTIRQAKMAFTRMKRMLKPLILAKLVRTNDSERTISLPNGAVIWFLTGEIPDNLFGEDVFAAVIDEASRMREEAWIAIRSTVTATRGPIRIIGNVKGRKNWFYRLSRVAEAAMASGDPDLYYDKLTAYDAVAGGVLDAAEIENARKMLPPQAFAELYLAEPSADGENPFGMHNIATCIRSKLDVGPVASWGVDLAKSVDFTVPIGLNHLGNMAAFDRYQRSWQQTKMDLRQRIGTVPALIDSTGVGDPIVEELQIGRSNIQGFKFTGPSRQMLLEGLAMYISERAASGDQWIYEGPGRVVRNELESFEYVATASGVKYRAPDGDGFHDDTVMALALAVEQFRHRGRAASKGGATAAL